MWPTLRARDAPALIPFLVDVLGFEETFFVVDGDVVQHAQLSWPESRSSCRCTTPTTGSRDFTIRDVAGNRWSFGTYRGEPRKG